MNKILIVEDNIALCRFYSRVLDQGGMKVTQANSCQAAIAYLEEEIPDLVLLDLRLPDGNGQSIVDYMKSHPILCATPIVVVSADIQPKDQTLHQTVSRVMTKPVSTWALLEVMKDFGFAAQMTQA